MCRVTAVPKHSGLRDKIISLQFNKLLVIDWKFSLQMWCKTRQLRLQSRLMKEKMFSLTSTREGASTLAVTCLG